MAIRLALRDIKNKPLFFIFFALNFALGLSGFVTLDTFKTSLQKTLEMNSKEFLSADLAVSARRLLSPQELGTVREGLREQVSSEVTESRVLEFFTMTAGNKTSRLVQLKAVDKAFPLYGKMLLQDGSVVIKNSMKDINSQPQVWVYPEILHQLGVKLGDELSLGKKKFKISKVITEDSTQTFRLAALAPRVYIGTEFVEETGLIAFGSTLTDAYLFAFSGNENPVEVKKQLLKKFDDPNIRISSPEDAQESTGRVLNYLNDYLGLVSLVGLFLSLIGSTYLYRYFINSRIKSVAIFNALGMNFQKAFALFISQLVMIAFFASLLALALAQGLAPLVNELISALTPIKIQLGLTGKTILVSISIAVFGCILVALPFLVVLQKVKPSSLLQEGEKFQLKMGLQQVLWFIPALLFFYGLCLWQANSIRVGSIFYFSLIGSLSVLFIVSKFLFRLLSKALWQKNWKLSQASLAVTRIQVASVPIVISLGLCTLLMNLIPQIKSGIQDEFTFAESLKLPSLFLFDIQDEQISGLQTVTQQFQMNIDNLSPMVRGRILAVNDQAFERSLDTDTAFRTREEETESRFRNRGVNLTYRNNLYPSEKIVEGQFFFSEAKKNPSPLPEISIEERYAQRLGLKLGDKMKFEVQGVDVEGKITNVRAVKWNSFQPNFFIVFEPGVLDEAPKTWLASLRRMSADLKNNIQTAIVEAFPNISIIDIDRTVTRISDMVEKMAAVLSFMVFISLVVGVVVVYSISYQQVTGRQWDINLLKILGAGSKDIFLVLFYEFFFLGLIASFIGVALGGVTTVLIGKIMFDGLVRLNIFWASVSIVTILAISTLTAVFAARKIVRSQPLLQLKEGSS